MDENIKKVGNAMDNVAKLNEKGITVQGGKKYTQVVARVEAFRREFGFTYGIDTDILFPANGGAVVKAKVLSDQGHLIGSGMAFSKNINMEKCLEKLETTAIGRALASCGLAGGEYASDDEIKTYEERYTTPINPMDDNEKREFSFTKENLDYLIEQIDGCHDADELDKLKAGANKEKPNMRPHHIAKVRKAITDKEAFFAERELDENMFNAIGANQ